MAKDQTRRLSPSDLSKDEASFNALQKLAGYVPHNPAYSIEAILQAITAMRARQAAEDQAIAALATARDEATSQEWVVHNLMLGSKDQVRALFGNDSLQLQEIGLKRASDYKTRRPSSKTIQK